MSDTLYSTDGKGNWWKTVYHPKCEESTFLRDGACQGAKGHAGNHWSYSENGSYLERELTGGCSSTPPDNKHWISPADKAKEHYLNFNTTTQVTDPEELKRLEAGDDMDGASIDRPVSKEELEELGLTDIIKEIKDDIG